MQGIFRKENTDKALKYGIYRHLPTYEKIIRNLVSFYIKKAKEGYAGLTCRSVKKWEDRDKEVWLSDHYPICAELEWINL